LSHVKSVWSRTRRLAAGALPALALSALACASGGVGTSGGTGGTSSASGSGGGTTASSGGGAVGASSSGAGPSSSSGGGGTTASSAVSSSSGGGPVCHWKLANPCGPGMFCQAVGCGDGTCEPVGTSEDPLRQPVCGCDGVTYWNASVADSHGMATQSQGECSPAKTCGGFGGTQCPAGASCNYRQADKNGCGIADGSGACWTTPAVCMPVVGFGPQTRACGAALCADECELIKQETLWYPDNTCPQ
jgi:hypothetical protein